MKRNLFARIACALLASLMLVTTVACGNSNGDNGDATTTTTVAGGENTPGGDGTTAPGSDAQTEAPANTDVNGYLKDDIPETLGYNGKTVTLLTWEDVEHEEFFVESQTGDIVNDAMFTRQQAVEERLGITFEEVMTKGNSDNVNGWVTYVQQDNMSGSHEFDVMAAYSLSMSSTASKNLCYDLLDPDCEYLNFDQPWWPDTLIEQATINDKLFFASGDISMNVLYMMYVCYVNNGLLETYKLENPADLVADGKWTYDKFIEMCTGVYADVNGNGIKDTGDQFGYMSSGIHVDPWFYGSGTLIVDKDETGALRAAPSFFGETVISSIDKLNSLLWDTNDGIYTSSVKHQAEFRDGHLLFAMDRARVSFRTLAANEELSYSIVPAPKYDEDQDRYYTVMGNPFTLYAIPADSQDPAMASAVMECFASESYRQTTPAVFEITLKLKYSQDEVSSQMYDLIRENVVFDLGRLFSSVLIGQGNFRTCISGNANNWASVTKAYEKPLANKIAALEKAFE